MYRSCYAARKQCNVRLSHISCLHLNIERTRKIYAYFRKCWSFSYSEIWQCGGLRCVVSLSFLFLADYAFAQNLFHALSTLRDPISRPQFRKRCSHTTVQHLFVTLFYNLCGERVIPWKNNRSSCIKLQIRIDQSSCTSQNSCTFLYA